MSWLDIAKGEDGIHELPGPENNARIVEYLSSTELEIGLAAREETPWCSAFVNWVMMKAGMPRTRSAMARSWLKWGRATVPRLGAITVFKRGLPPSGHVAFYISDDGINVKVFGGNQGNKVCYALYPKSDVIDYRWPNGI